MNSLYNHHLEDSNLVSITDLDYFFDFTKAQRAILGIMRIFKISTKQINGIFESIYAFRAQSQSPIEKFQSCFLFLFFLNLSIPV